MTDLSPVVAEGVNAKAYSVSELAFALKRTIEDAYGFVRLRGELSKVGVIVGGDELEEEPE